MEEAYDFELQGDNVVETGEGRIYRAIDEGEKCNFGEVFETDGRIEALDLTPLEDDERFFPTYNPSLSVREEVADEHPGIADVFAPISEELDDRTLRGLNAAVAVDS